MLRRMSDTNPTIEFRGETKTLTQWARARRIPAKMIRARIASGWTPYEALCVVPKGRKGSPPKRSKAWRYKGAIRTNEDFLGRAAYRETKTAEYDARMAELRADRKRASEASEHDAPPEKMSPH